MELIEQALQVAVTAHKEQVRKSDGSPYVVHPIMVSRIVEHHGFSEIVVAAALAHDVLEDTDVTEDELRAKLGEAVVDIVLAVSEDKSLDWEARKEAYIEQVATASDEVKAVSVADKIHNTQSFLKAYAEQGPAVWKKFSRGKEKSLWFHHTLYQRLQQEWQHPMLDEFASLVSKLEELPE